MDELLKSHKVLVCVGSGGVGKTTLAASLGVLAALNGQRVLVLTVDPARRLATTLGITEGTERKIPFEESQGELTASIIDPKKTFDDFVTKAAGQGTGAEKLFKNKLYKQLSTTLSGSQEFTALEKLYSSYQSGKYDLIILDTPPTEHAIDFLNSPQNISALFDERISRWFVSSGRGPIGMFGGLVSMGTKKAFAALENLTGSEFISELRSFFATIQDWRAKLTERTQDVHRLLVHPDTAFVLVTSFDQAKLLEADRFRREITKNGYSLEQIFINRAYPEWLSLDDPLENPSEPPGQLQSYYQELSSYYREKLRLYEAYEQQIAGDVPITKLPYFEEDISDLTGLRKLAKILV